MAGPAGSPTFTVYADVTLIQGQGHGAFELPTTSEAVHAGGDDRRPLAGLSGLNICICFVSDIAIFVLKRDVKLQLTNYVFAVLLPDLSRLSCHSV